MKSEVTLLLSPPPFQMFYFALHIKVCSMALLIQRSLFYLYLQIQYYNYEMYMSLQSGN